MYGLAFDLSRMPLKSEMPLLAESLLYCTIVEYIPEHFPGTGPLLNFAKEDEIEVQIERFNIDSGCRQLECSIVSQQITRVTASLPAPLGLLNILLFRDWICGSEIMHAARKILVKSSSSRS